MQVLDLVIDETDGYGLVEERVWEQYVFMDCAYWTPEGSLGAYNRQGFGLKPSQSVLVRIPCRTFEFEEEVLKRIRKSLDLHFPITQQ